MSSQIYLEVKVLAVSICYGIAIVAVYDMLRILRRAIPHGYVMIAFEDMCFWIGVTLAVFKMLFYRNNGELRFYIIAAVAFGMVIYLISVSRYIVKYGTGVLSIILKYLLKPLKIAAKTIRMGADKSENRVKKWLQKRKIRTARRRQERVQDEEKEDSFQTDLESHRS